MRKEREREEADVNMTRNMCPPPSRNLILILTGIVTPCVGMTT
jgi:hypothetical protein